MESDCSLNGFEEYFSYFCSDTFYMTSPRLGASVVPMAFSAAHTNIEMPTPLFEEELFLECREMFLVALTVLIASMHCGEVL